MRPTRRPRRWLRGFSGAAIFFLCWELAAQSAFGLLELSLFGLAVCLGACLLQVPPAKWGKLVKKALLWGRPGFWLLAAAGLYLLVDMAVALASPSPQLMLQKYKVVAALLPVVAAVLLLGETGCRTARRAIALASPAICLMAVANHFWIGIYPRHYALRLSLRADYNMFASVVFFGMVVGAFDALREGKSRRAQLAGLLFFLLPALCVISRSASRRIYIALIPTLAVLLWAAWKTLGPISPWALPRAVAALCLVLLCAWSGELLLRQAMERQLASGRLPPTLALAGTGETTAEARYASIADGSLLNKRRVIWGLALDELSRYRLFELLVGRGGGHDIVMYDTIGEPLDAGYPDRALRKGALSAHNMLLADLLNGGLLKLLSLLPLLAVTVWLALCYVLRAPISGLPVAVGLALCLLNSMISNRFGLLYDRYFYIFAVLLAVEYSQLLSQYGRGHQ